MVTTQIQCALDREQGIVVGRDVGPMPTIGFGPLSGPGSCRQPGARWVMVGVPQAPLLGWLG
jgi:hypothetical protein